jgi:hypothetical protein
VSTERHYVSKSCHPERVQHWNSVMGSRPNNYMVVIMAHLCERLAERQHLDETGSRYTLNGLKRVSLGSPSYIGVILLR